ncbi:hypothetical protein BASA83_005714 [Batrachochytrium salamandrivorans]|nr:hypothetical protein BASA83_005714 [Batrachochytrium salamandrivorans]
MQNIQHLSVLYAALRTQQDLFNSVPISRQPGIGVHLTSTVFANTNFTTNRLNVYLIPLLLNFVNRVVLDLYWDNSTLSWQLCPLPFLPATTKLAPTGSTTDAQSNTQVSIVELAGGIFCSTDRLGLGSVLHFINGFLKNQTRTELDNPITIVLNLHSLNQSSTAAASQSYLTLGDQIASFPNVYTPIKLAADRSGKGINSLISPYFFQAANNTYLTNISYPRQETMTDRIFVVFGAISVNATLGYASTNDNDYIFSTSQLSGVPTISTNFLSASGITSCSRPAANIAMQGTGFDLGLPTYSVPASEVLSTDTVVSWNYAYIQDTKQVPFTPSLVSQSVTCGFTPLFTQAYSISMLNATLWSWDVGQPSEDYRFNCALALLERERWVVESCEVKYPVACVDRTAQPYIWTLSHNVTAFNRAHFLCPPPLTFSVPRTGPEQVALINAMRVANVSAVWVNFIRVSTLCWVQGWNTECPYVFVTDVLLEKVLGANLKQGILILVICLLFLAYQVRSQLRLSRENRRRLEVRRKIKQMEYKSIAKME